MIVSRTPLRISFFGGGTDLKSFYDIEDGQVLSSAINKYIYVTTKRQLDIVDFKYRVAWSQSEFKNRIDDIEHPLVREALKLLKMDFPIEITTFSDIPANTGLGSSSTFAVGLLHALFALQNQMVTKSVLAAMAAQIEIEILKRASGKQDHYAAAYGNMNVITFKKDGSVFIEPVFYKPEVKEQLENSMMMFFTKQRRDSSDVLKKISDAPKVNYEVLKKMKSFVPIAQSMLTKGDLVEFGKLLNQTWELKRSLAEEISNPNIDEYYAKAMEAGAWGGKLLGAGGGGFLLFMVPPEKQNKVRAALSNLVQVKTKFDNAGTRITYYDPGPV